MRRLASSDVIARVQALDERAARWCRGSLISTSWVPIRWSCSARSASRAGSRRGSTRTCSCSGTSTRTSSTAWAGLFVRGTLRATQLVYLCSGNDCRAQVTGALESPLVIERGTRTSVGACAGRVISTHNEFLVGGERVPHTEDDEAVLRALLVPEVFEPDENGNGGLHENLAALVTSGRRVVR